MRHPLEKLGVILGVMITLSWPMLLGAVIAGRDGIVYGGLIYLVFGALLAMVLVLGGIRGILGS